MSTYNLTIDHTKVPSAQTNFPIYVNLNDVISGMTTAQANSIRVYKADGVTEVAREIVSSSEMHFKADSVSSSADTVFVIDIDGSRSDYSASDTYGRNNVWTNGYAAVLHYEGGVTNSTGGATVTDISSTSTAGKLGSGRINNPGGLYIDSPLNGANTVTLESWFDVPSSTTWVVMELTSNFNGGTDAHPGIIFDTYESGKTNFGVKDTSGYKIGVVASTTGVKHYAMTVNVPAGGSALDRIKGYINGVQQTLTASYNTSWTMTAFGDDKLYIGGRAGTSYNPSNMYDETRVSNVVRSPDWITTQYNNQNSPSTFYSVALAPLGNTTNFFNMF